MSKANDYYNKLDEARQRLAEARRELEIQRKAVGIKEIVSRPEGAYIVARPRSRSGASGHADEGTQEGSSGGIVRTGVDLIAIERQRQIDVEGWTPEHDDEHTHCELIDASLCHAGVAGSQLLDADGGEEAKVEMMKQAWPWDRDWWKPSSDPVINLVKAGALIAAEIDRLQRAAAQSKIVEGL